MASSFEEKSDKPRHVSGLVKLVILVQAAIILSFTVWTYQEYLNNVYLQEYIIGLIRTRTSRRRHRKPKIDADDLYRSMLQYSDDHRY